MEQTQTNFKKYLTGSSVSLDEMLESRELRSWRQNDLIAVYRKPVICFTMNIAGPVKQNPLIQRAFDLGYDSIKKELLRIQAPILYECRFHNTTGNEGYLAADLEPLHLKALAIEIEEQDDLGRLYDIDILYPDENDPSNIKKVERRELGFSERPCLICGKPGKACASRRIHTIEEIQEKTGEILLKQILGYDQLTLAEFAVRSLLYEVSITPKPGLVDRRNTGSHTDMDFYSFINSSVSLYPYFQQCAKIGQNSVLADESPVACFHRLRMPGKTAEGQMLSRTGGVNTHKGAIFTIGILVAASARCITKSMLNQLPSPADASAILSECMSMTQGLVSDDFKDITRENAVTIGQKLYIDFGITGIRGQMEAGLPAIRDHGLPMLSSLLSSGESVDCAGAITLLSVLGYTDDTNMIHRGNREIQLEESNTAKNLSQKLKGLPWTDAERILSGMDDRYMKRNLSPGGSADLMAACWYLHFTGEEYV